MYNKYYKIIFGLIYLLPKEINNFYVLSFDTILVKDELCQENLNFYDYLFQSELYTNLTVGSPPKDIKSLIKFESNGFYIYQKAYNYTLSTTHEKYFWPIDQWFFNSISLMIFDHFYFISYENYDDFIQSNNKGTHLIQTNKTLFVMMFKAREIFDKKYDNYAYIGLNYDDKQSTSKSPETMINFINTANKRWKLNNSKFYFDFNKDNYTYNHFFNNYHRGNFILGKDLADEKNETGKIKYTHLSKDNASQKWIIKFDKIYSLLNKTNIEKDNSNKTNKNNTEFNYNYNQLYAELKLNKPYIIGTSEYYNYINKSFFNDLIIKKICFINLLNYTYNKNELFGISCKGDSDYFLNLLKNKFPELIFESKDLEKKFSLNIYDLFSYNIYNKSDTNLYFLILFYKIEKTNNKNWILGIPFFKKYTLSFDYENKKIGYYYKTKVKNKEIKNNKIILQILKVLGIIFLICIIFIFGMICQKKINKIPRKIKANELEENYIYENSYDKNNNYKNNDKDINSIESKNNKSVELGFKLFD